MNKLEKSKKVNKTPREFGPEGNTMSQKDMDALREEAMRIEEELDDSDDAYLDTLDPPKELYEKIVQELRDKGIYKEDELHPQEREVYVEEKSKIVVREVNQPRKVLPYRRWQRAGKWVAVLCVTLIGVFGLTMTSEANRVYMLRQVDSLFGNDVTVKRNNDSDRKDSLLTEEGARESIENKLNVEVPLLMKKPLGMVYESYEVSEEAGVAIVQYGYQDNTISLFISNNQQDTSEYSSYDGTLIKSINIQSETIKIDVWEIKAPDDESPSYMAQWKYKNCYYEFSGKLEKEEFINTVEKIIY